MSFRYALPKIEIALIKFLESGNNIDDICLFGEVSENNSISPCSTEFVRNGHHACISECNYFVLEILGHLY